MPYLLEGAHWHVYVMQTNKLKRGPGQTPTHTCSALIPPHPPPPSPTPAGTYESRAKTTFAGALIKATATLLLLIWFGLHEEVKQEGECHLSDLHTDLTLPAIFTLVLVAGILLNCIHKSGTCAALHIHVHTRCSSHTPMPSPQCPAEYKGGEPAGVCPPGTVPVTRATPTTGTTAV